MHHRAGRAISAVLEGAVDEMVRNDAAYRLARIQFQKGQMADAMHSLERIDGRVPAAIEDDIEFLRANIHLAEGRPAAAIAPLENLQHSKQFAAFAAYNLGIAFLQNGSKQEAIAQLDRAGQVSASDPGELAIRDKSNLVLGTLFLEQGEFAEAATHLDRVRLDGPYSNQALLSSGWANVSAERLERAIVPWGILAEREVTDRATQEAMLSLPFALAGGFWFIWLLDYQLSVAVAVGFIALAGVSAEFGVVMLIYLDNALKRFREEGHLDSERQLRMAIEEGAVLRVRPKAMTVAVIIAGLLPIMLSEGTGSEVMQRIAAPMVGGLISATVLTLLIIPAIYMVWKRAGLRREIRFALESGSQDVER